MSRYENMLFNYGTTGRTDFRYGTINPVVKTEYKEKPKRPREQSVPVKFVYTMQDWKGHLPFSSTIKLRDILQTNPGDVQKRFEPFVDHEKTEVQRTRPRLVMTPAVSMDDIAPEARDILIKSTYTSATHVALEAGVTPYSNVKAPLPDLPTRADPISLPKHRPPYVPEEWRMESVKWDRRQLRSNVDPTKEFWLMPEHKPTRCKACEETAIVAAQRDMLHNMKTARP